MRDPAIDHVGHCSPCFVELTDLRRAIHRRSIIWKGAGAAAAALVLALLANYFDLQRSDPRIAGPIGHAVATIDLRNVSTARSVQPSGTGVAQPQIAIPRANLSLTIQLPIGSEEGNYEVSIRTPHDTTGKVHGSGMAHLESGVTKLTIALDTSAISPGDYELSWRMADFDWRHVQISIR